MAIQNSSPTHWTPRGLTDAQDGTNSFPGAMKRLADMIPDAETAGLYAPRPAAQILTDLTGANAPTGPGDMQAMLTVGDFEYGMVASTRFAGKDEPFCYDLANGVFLPIFGITSANVPTTQPSAGDWTPPIMAQVSPRVIVTHPGFPGGAIKFGWFDISGFSDVTLGNTHTSTLIDGSPAVLGVQPGMTITGGTIPANTSVVATAEFVLVTRGILEQSSLSQLQSTVGIAVGQDVEGLNIPAGTTVLTIALAPFSGTGATHSNNVVDDIVLSGSDIISIGDRIAGTGIPANSEVVSIAVVSPTVLASLNGTATIQTATSADIAAGMSVSGFGIPAATKVVSSTPFSLTTSGDILGISITNLASTAGVVVGMTVSGFGIPAGTRVMFIVSPTEVAISQAGTQTTLQSAIEFSGSAVVLDAAATVTAIFVQLTFVSISVGMSLPATATAAGVALTFTSTTVNLSKPSLLSVRSDISATFTGTTITLSAAATGTADGVSLTIAGGTRAAPLWGAGDCDRNPLLSTPLGIMQMNGRAYFADGLDGIPFSDSGMPCRRSNQPNVQALLTDDGTAVTVIAPLELSAPITGGIVQAAIAFSGNGAMRQITGDMATGDLKMNLLPIATGTEAPLSVIPCSLGTAFISPQGLRFVRQDGSVSDPVGVDGQGVTHPFQYARYPSRICAEANVAVLRVTVQHMSKPGEPFEEYWYDLSRKTWSGPHSFPARLIQHWRSTFVIAPLAAAGLWRSDTVGPHLGGGTAADFIENGLPLFFTGETVLLPDNSHMAMNAMVEANLNCAIPPGGTVQVVALTEQGNALDGLILTSKVYNSDLRQRQLNWHEPIVFKQTSVQFRGASNSRVRIGNLYMRYEILGYNNDEDALTNSTYLRVVPLTGDTITATAGLGAFRIAPTGELAALAVVLPPSPADGDIFCISTTQTLDSVTVTAPGGATMAGTSGGPFTLGANGGTCWQYDLGLNQWLPVG